VNEPTKWYPVQQHVWLLVYYTSRGEFQPSGDYSFPYRTRSAALSKKRQLGELGKNYRVVKYVCATKALPQ